MITLGCSWSFGSPPPSPGDAERHRRIVQGRTGSQPAHRHNEPGNQLDARPAVRRASRGESAVTTTVVGRASRPNPSANPVGGTEEGSTPLPATRRLLRALVLGAVAV